MKRWALGLVIVLLWGGLLGVGCAKSSKAYEPINRTFYGLTLGMSEEDFRKSVVYGISVVNGVSQVYSVYSQPYHSLYPQGKDIYDYDKRDLFGNPRKIGKKPAMPLIEGIYDVECSFYQGQLWKILVVYSGHHPQYRSLTFDQFVSSARDRYGPGKSSSYPVSVEWEDGQTRLLIGEQVGEQSGAVVRHYVAVYTDQALKREIEEATKSLAPRL